MTSRVLLMTLACIFHLSVCALAGDAVETGRRALKEAGAFPWYDSETDQLRRVALKPVAEPKAHYNDWEAAPASNNWLTSLFAFLAALMRGVVWLLIALLLFGLLALLAFGLTRRQSLLDARAGVAVQELMREGESIERLPFQLRQPKADLLSEIRRHYEAGKYKEAIVYLFSYQLVLLDKHHHIRLAKGKTNRQYVCEVGASNALGGLLRGTMLAFEDTFFGDHLLDRKGFEACWNMLDEFQRLAEGNAP